MVEYACGITFFNPTIDIIENAYKYCDLFDFVYVYDNTEIKERNEKVYDRLNEIINDQRIIYLTEGVNKGLPYAFNRIIENVLQKESIVFLCSLDQDSEFLPEDVKAMKAFIEEMENNKEYAVIAPHILYNAESNSKASIIKECRYVIASGSFINIQALKESGVRYDENYFIDRFEVDFERQLQKKGYKIGEYYGAVLYQKLGTESGHKHPNHSALRHYYIFRNRFYFNRKFYKKSKAILLNITQTVKHLCLIMFFEDHKIQKISQLSNAYKDYKNSVFGARRTSETGNKE